MPERGGAWKGTCTGSAVGEEIPASASAGLASGRPLGECVAAAGGDCAVEVAVDAAAELERCAAPDGPSPDLLASAISTPNADQHAQHERAGGPAGAGACAWRRRARGARGSGRG